MTLKKLPGLTPPELSKLTSYALGEDKLPSNIKLIVTGGTGSGNLLYTQDDLRTELPLTIQLLNKSSDNVVIIGFGSRVAGNIFFHGSRCCVAYGEDIRQLSPISVRFWNNDQQVIWGRAATSNGTHIFVHGSSRRVLVGDHCMLADGITIRTADQHGIFDLKSGNLLNPSADVVVEPYVWLCQDVILLKGSHVGFGSIVGARSVVTGPVQRHILAAGQPAKAIRTGVGWTRREYPEPGIVERLKLECEALPSFDSLYGEWTRS